MPVEDSLPDIEISHSKEKENTAPSHTSRLSRSPHPYFRRQNPIEEATLQTHRLTTKPRTAPVEAVVNRHTRPARQNGFQKGHDLTSPSDSGTEADDERGVFLKGLPAPPIKWRKGLKDSGDTASPLLTPSYLDDDERRLALEHQWRRSQAPAGPDNVEDESLKIREKFRRRRRAELLRRITETVLLGTVGYIACSTGLAITPGELGVPYASVSASHILHVEGIPVILGHLSIVLAVYLSYLLGVFYRHRDRQSSNGPAWRFMRIPAAFDPATLLYPIFVPVFIAASLAPSNAKVLVPNLILSIASIPRAILPIHDDFLGYGAFQWMASLAPLLIFQLYNRLSSSDTSGNAQSSFDSVDPEILTLLYPLHQVLLPTLAYLTTTSLLPSELQLLSVAMVNVLLFSAAPQALILQALLWIGGVSTFVLCGQMLRWAVSLARIPSWRFRHPRLRSRDGPVILAAIDDCFGQRLSQRASTATDSEGSTDDGIGGTNRSASTRKPLDKLKIAIPNRTTAGSLHDSVAPQSAQAHRSSRMRSSIHILPDASQIKKRPQRRYTLPTPPTASLLTAWQQRSELFPKALSSNPKANKFISLTHAQAIIAKWLFAAYTYVAVVTIIAWPIRTYISRRALGDHEPVGWALGYLFGHVPIFRHYVLGSYLEDWIALPEPYDIYSDLTPSSWANALNQRLQGEANTRLLLCLYCALSIAAGLGIVFRLKDSVEVDTRRKVFHGMMVVMFLPAIFVDPAFVALALILVLAIFLLLDLFRASQLPPLSKPLTAFLAPYVDGRDYRGPVIVSHIFLLIGCAIPLWLSLAAAERSGEAPWEGWDIPTRELSMISGVVCVGMGDAAASLIGRRYGRRRWCWSGGKSLEGSFAFALAVVLGLSLGRAWLLLGGWVGDSGDAWNLALTKAAVAATGASLTEAVLTGGNDNVVVPIILWLLVRGLKM